MKRRFILAATLAAFAIPAISAAADDPIKARQLLMDSNAAATAVSAGLMKGEIPYNPAVAKAAIQAFAATAGSVGYFFPDGSTGDSAAAPKIWEDAAGWQAELGEFAAAANAAASGAGKEGPADLAAFTALVQPVLGTCKECHESYRLKR